MAVPQLSLNKSLREMAAWLLEPHAGLTDQLEIRRARLMMALALVLAALSLLSALLVLALGGTVALAVSLLAWGVFCADAYVLGRTRWGYLGSLLLLVSTLVLGYWLAFNASLEIDSGQALYATFILAYVMGSVMLDVRGLGVLVLVSTLGVFLLAPLSPGLNLANLVWEMGIILALGLLLMVVTGYRNGLEALRLAALQDANRELTEIQSTLEQRVEERTRSAEAALSEAEEARRQTEQAWLKTGAQAWRDAGRVQLGEIMRGEQELSALAAQTLAKICQIMDAQAGALYLAQSSVAQPTGTQSSATQPADALPKGALAKGGRPDRLYFVGGYAFAVGEGVPLDFALGEGLVGQAALDRRSLMLNIRPDAEAPAGALVVQLGLGKLRPRQLLLQPILYGERLVGVLELATMHEFPSVGLEFLESVSESMGVAFYTAQTRAQVNDLLQQTQVQAEELQAREEELRSMNEELQTQAEGMRRGWEARPSPTDTFRESG